MYVSFAPQRDVSWLEARGYESCVRMLSPARIGADLLPLLPV
jgi:hypothetical protein